MTPYAITAAAAVTGALIGALACIRWDLNRSIREERELEAYYRLELDDNERHPNA